MDWGLCSPTVGKSLVTASHVIEFLGEYVSFQEARGISVIALTQAEDAYLINTESRVD